MNCLNIPLFEGLAQQFLIAQQKYQREQNFYPKPCCTALVVTEIDLLVLKALYFKILGEMKTQAV